MAAAHSSNHGSPNGGDGVEHKELNGIQWRSELPSNGPQRELDGRAVYGELQGEWSAEFAHSDGNTRGQARR